MSEPYSFDGEAVSEARLDAAIERVREQSAQQGVWVNRETLDEASFCLEFAEQRLQDVLGGQVAQRFHEARIMLNAARDGK